MFAQSALKSAATRNALMRSERYGFSPYKAKNAWGKWREQQMLAAMPPNEHTQITPGVVRATFIIGGIVGFSFPIVWAFSKKP